jgi:hypothetical protein
MTAPNRASVLDERFFDHRRRSTSIAGIVGGVLAGALFLYRHYVDHVWNWDVLAVAAAIAVIKVVLMAWYYLTD